MVRHVCLLSLFLSFHLVYAGNDTVIHGWVREPDGRGTWSIIWSSLVTISLCTWSALHLSVPKYHERWKLVLRRCKYFLIALLAPEAILIFSLQSYVDARNAVLELQQFGGPQWTMVHAQFLMGEGFKVIEQDSTSDPEYDPVKFRQLVRWGVVDSPPVSSDELQSRSKSDWLVKVIAILQILYFASQTVFRALQHIQVTPLEILVVSFIFCSLLSYTFNWSTPQDVEYPIIVRLRSDWRPYMPEKTEIVTAQNGTTEVAIPQNHISQQNALQEHELQPEIPQPTSPQQRERQSQIITHYYAPKKCYLDPVPIPKPFPAPIDGPTQKFSWNHSAKEWRTFEPVPIPKPYLAPIDVPTQQLLANHSATQSRTLEIAPIPKPYTPVTDRHERQSLTNDSAPESRTFEPVPVPEPDRVTYRPKRRSLTDYSTPQTCTLQPAPSPDPYDTTKPESRLAKLLFAKGVKARGFYSICIVLSTIFGAIHCAGWNSPFPSYAEMVIWRVCAIMTTALAIPCVWLVRTWMQLDSYIRVRNVRRMRISMFILGGLYAIARVMLIVLAFTTLRALPAETYETVEWTRYLPNFSS